MSGDVKTDNLTQATLDYIKTLERHLDELRTKFYGPVTIIKRPEDAAVQTYSNQHEANTNTVKQ